MSQKNDQQSENNLSEIMQTENGDWLSEDDSDEIELIENYADDSGLLVLGSMGTAVLMFLVGVGISDWWTGFLLALPFVGLFMAALSIAISDGVEKRRSEHK